MKAPNRWSEIKIHQFYELRALLEMRDLPNIDKNVQLLSVLTGKPIDVIEDLTFNQIASHIAGISFVDKMPKAAAKRYIFVRGCIFKVHLDPSKITPAQFIDLSMFTKDANTIIENIHNILAVICTPVFRKYNGKSHKKRADLFVEHLDVETAYGIALFFCRLINAFLPAISDYLEQTAREQIANLKNSATSKSSSSIGVGTTHLTKSAGAII